MCQRGRWTRGRGERDEAFLMSWWLENITRGSAGRLGFLSSAGIHLHLLCGPNLFTFFSTLEGSLSTHTDHPSHLLTPLFNYLQQFFLLRGEQKAKEQRATMCNVQVFRAIVLGHWASIHLDWQDFISQRPEAFFTSRIIQCCYRKHSSHPALNPIWKKETVNLVTLWTVTATEPAVLCFVLLTITDWWLLSIIDWWLLSRAEAH